MFERGVEPAQVYDQSRTTFDSAKARVESVRKQAVAAQAAVALAEANQDQVAMRRAALEGMNHQMAATAAQREKAKVRLDYTQIRAPKYGIVDVRSALQGEVVNPGQAIVTGAAAGGPVVLASDAVHYYEELERDRPFSTVANLADNRTFSAHRHPPRARPV